ncbi:DedA family protein [Novosphingobium sp. 9]|uniref:DedA family protein n=1 Tax=Novosphingobium sp. 9 TaxID=2025349 RepID=UPI0021B54281|nr:DedA family protein [Novosphingobium sp. 9]
MFLGSGIEGETAAVMGGILAHRGTLSLGPALLAASLGSFVVDQGFFLLGRCFRHRPFVQRMQEKAVFAKALSVFERYPLRFVFGFRFLTGLRTVSPLAIGTTKIRARTFLLVNLIAALVWGAIFVGLGYCFGQAIQAAFGRLRSVVPILLGVAALAGLGTLAMRWRKRRRERREA